MGQKINPLGFRLGTNQRHHSIWFAHRKKYFEHIREDKKIRDYIKNFIQNLTSLNIKKNVISQGVAGIARIEIFKRSNVMNIIIHTGFPKVLTKDESKKLRELQINIQNGLNFMNRKLKMTILEIPRPYGHANILAEFLSIQLENRVAFRKAMQKVIELSEEATPQGIRVQIAGRINGKEIARVESTKEGRIPLHTIVANIDYCSYPVRTIHGVLGIKIWIFIDEQNEALIWSIPKSTI